MNLIPELEWSMVVLHIRDLLYAYILALPIGWDREKNALVLSAITFFTLRIMASAKELTDTPGDKER